MSSYDKPGPLDGAIDAAVREMMTVDPRPGLRQRVTRRINTPPRRAYGLRFGFAAAGLVMVAFLAILMLRPSVPVEPVHAPQVAVAPPLAPAPPLAGPPPVDAPIAAPRPAPVRPQPRVTPTPESIFGPRQGRVAAASVPPARVVAAATAFWLEIRVTAARQSAVAPMALQPLMLGPLAIQPLVAGETLPRK